MSYPVSEEDMQKIEEAYQEAHKDGTCDDATCFDCYGDSSL